MSTISAYPQQEISSIPASCVSVRRRANMQQGKALEILAHAIEYLVDSRMFLIDEPASPSDAEAIQTLSRLSRTVFSECREATPLSHQLKVWIITGILRTSR